MTLRDLTHHLDLFITSPMSGETIDPSIHPIHRWKNIFERIFFLDFLDV